MEKTVNILSAGPGGRESMSLEAASLADAADLLIGAARLVEAWPHKQSIAEYRPDWILRIIGESSAGTIAVLVSGDAGFFSGAGAIARALEAYQPAVYPGISSLAAFSAKTGIPYDNARLISAHGRDINIVSEVRRHRVTFVLGGGNLDGLIRRLQEYHMDDVQLFVGENLGSDRERILEGTPGDLAEQPLETLALMAVINEQAQALAAVSVPDGELVRGSVPMTKELVRGAIIRRLQLREDSIVYDIGAGTGSVSVEAALNAWRGTVYAFDYKEEAIRLIRENALRMQADNVVAVQGTAPDVLRGHPLPDAVFIGGSEGKLNEILEELLRLREESGQSAPASDRTEVQAESRTSDRPMTVVISAVTLQTLEEAAALLKRFAPPDGEGASIVQVAETRLKPVGRYDMFRPETPVFLLSATL